jgi:sugar lactone lactonase YvrE
MPPFLSIDECQIFHDGTVTEPRLLHPEGVAVDRHGDIWCGGELGHIYRISGDGTNLEVMASTGGFILGIAFDSRGRLYACDLKHKSVFRFDPENNDLTTFASGNEHQEMRVPNWPVVDAGRNALYVSDSYDSNEPGPGIWRFDLDTGEGALWYDQPLSFANGMALTGDGSAILVTETFGNRISQIRVNPDGTAGERGTVVELGDVLPDGLALDVEGNVYIACYEPSQIMRLRTTGDLETFVSDPQAHTLCHPTNCAFRGNQLFIANLGRWHITTVTTATPGLRLPVTPTS